MELEHSFSVPVPAERAWDVLLDVERVAPCMPGATLDSVEGDSIVGRIKVKVGPITMTYAGTAKFTERDTEARVITLEASGKETRGAGTASASVHSRLLPEGDHTQVTVQTTLNVTGKPAQFGRGVMNEVGAKLIGIFADNLAAMLAAESAGDADITEEEEIPGGNVVALASGTPDEALPIDVLNLSTRAWSSLRHDGIQTLGDLTRRTDQQLLAIDGVGPASLTDIKAKLADRGLALAPAEASGPSGAAPSQAAAPSRPAAAGAAETPGPAEAAGSASGGAESRAAETALPGEPAQSTEAADLAGAQPADLNGARQAAAGKHAGAEAETGEDLAEVTPIRPARHETPPAAQVPVQREPTAWQPPDNDAIDLLDVAGLPVLKRAAPAAAALIAVLLVIFGLRRRRARRG
ncbi:MAG TPA: SRPBCC domain-containing protein [Streptosporangiaceae bacterium]|nr:SRPBCC domain-containing protein [Streptosporangiaceae bacterium]